MIGREENASRECLTVPGRPFDDREWLARRCTPLGAAAGFVYDEGRLPL